MSILRNMNTKKLLVFLLPTTFGLNILFCPEVFQFETIHLIMDDYSWEVDILLSSHGSKPVVPDSGESQNHKKNNSAA